MVGPEGLELAIKPPGPAFLTLWAFLIQVTQSTELINEGANHFHKIFAALTDSSLGARSSCAPFFGFHQENEGLNCSRDDCRCAGGVGPSGAWIA